MCTGSLFLPNIIFWPSFAKVGHHSNEQLLMWASHQALGFCLSQTLFFGDTWFIGDVSMWSFVKKGASLPSTCAPVHSTYMARFKGGWIFSDITKLLKIQYLMWMHFQKFVQPLLQERTFLAWHLQPTCGLGNDVEHFCFFVKIHTDKQLPEGMEILEWREEAKRKNWETSCCGCTVEEILQAM